MPISNTDTRPTAPPRKERTARLNSRVTTCTSSSTEKRLTRARRSPRVASVARRSMCRGSRRRIGADLRISSRASCSSVAGAIRSRAHSLATRWAASITR